MKRIKAFLEKWQHRLQGHMLVTWMDGDYICEVWALDVYSSFAGWHVDTVDGETILLSALHHDYTITGA